MDTRNYDEPYNCGLEECDCSEVDKCGCTFPHNLSNYGCDCTQNPQCDKFNEEKSFDQAQNPDYKKSRRVKEDTVCVCNKDECDCDTEITNLTRH